MRGICPSAFTPLQVDFLFLPFDFTLRSPMAIQHDRKNQGRCFPAGKVFGWILHKKREGKKGRCLGKAVVAGKNPAPIGQVTA